jgi:hypothetical protein
MFTARLPVVDYTDFPADLNGLVRCAERRNMVSAYVPSHFKRSLRHEAVYGNGGITPLILNLGARWRRVVSFRHQPAGLGFLIRITELRNP